MKGKLALLILLIAPLLTTGCVNLTVGASGDAPNLALNENFASGYANLKGIRPYNGTIAKASLLSDFNKNGELLSLGIWPLGEVGIGLLGARMQLLPFNAGFGTLFYQPDSSGDGVEANVDVDVSTNRTR